MEVNGDDLSDVSEYGYGFWMRYMSRYPVALYHGRNGPWQFVSRLTSNNPYGDLNFGDRTLAIFMGEEGYAFITNNEENGDANVHEIVEFNDIDGVWCYMYFSYSHVN